MNARRLVYQVLALVRGRRLDRELNDEIAAHLEMAEAEGLAAGLSPEQAKRRARLRFGGVDGMVEEHRDRRSVRWLENAVADVRFGTRMAVREPGFTAVVVGVLALGIGATAAMFSLFDAALIKALPFPHADRMVRVWEAPREGVVNATSAPDFLDWRRLGTSFASLWHAIWASRPPAFISLPRLCRASIAGSFSRRWALTFFRECPRSRATTTSATAW